MRRAICVEGDLCRWRSQCVSRRGTRTSKSGSGTAAKVDSRCALIGGFRSKMLCEPEATFTDLEVLLEAFRDGPPPSACRSVVLARLRSFHRIREQAAQSITPSRSPTVAGSGSWRRVSNSWLRTAPSWRTSPAAIHLHQWPATRHAGDRSGADSEFAPGDGIRSRWPAYGACCPVRPSRHPGGPPNWQLKSTAPARSPAPAVPNHPDRRASPTPTPHRRGPDLLATPIALLRGCAVRDRRRVRCRFAGTLRAQRVALE